MLSRIGSSLPAAMLFLAAYFITHALIRIALPDTLGLDESEQAFFSQYLFLGYGPQPPFYNWLQYAVVSVAGLSIWTLVIPKNIILFLCYVFYGLAAREALKDRALAAVAMLSLITLPQVGFLAQRELTHTVALLVATGLFLYGLFRTLQKPTLTSYLLVGTAAGIGMISKYNFAILPAAALLAVLADKDWRRCLLDWRVLAAIAISVLIVLPHALWLKDNIDSASTATLQRMTARHEASSAILRIGQGLVSLVVAVIGFSALPIVLFAAAFRRDLLRALRATSPMIRLIERMMMASLLAVALVVVGGASHIHERWLDPFLLVLPIYMLLKMQAAGIDLSVGIRRLLPVVPVAMVIIVTVLTVRIVGAQYVGNYPILNAPMAGFASELTATRRPNLIIASNKYLAGNFRLQLPEVPTVLPDFPDTAATDYANTKGPVLVLWRGPSDKEATMTPDFAARLKAAGIEVAQTNTLAMPYLFGHRKHAFAIGYAWIEGGAK
ncbi:4-amino-4-deoxy-L-arabinose transferase-like glycosyltransferase [Rhizobium sp. BK196]|uniref:glycosyltransferase family 39 protein n=1 Tax=Rhizobium sp. BK196 TaxID=2587073 RepID=UPI00161293BF|nr:glycosyltransferase family 39 protein [Rhizobium sp. BK196]MBB3310320.1 4-amino-4-deoxy-L-arabinose transferase-like glycosyltransferase [Rhizobium sp. BK196]